jgi:hypothetical protein
MVRSGSECCGLGLKSSVQASLFGLACAALGAVVASLCWASLELEVAASPRLVEPVRQVSTSADSSDASQHHEHHTHHCDDCAFCRARAAKMAEQLDAPFVPIHKRPDYTVQPPDMLHIEVSDPADPASSDQQPIKGEHLVHADGKVNLGSWGKLDVSGKTTAEIKTLVEELVDAGKSSRQVRVAVTAQNSRVYYIVNASFFGNPPDGDTIIRRPLLGNETALDAVTSIAPVKEMGRRQIFISRPTPGSEKRTAHERITQPSTDTAIPIRWHWTSPTTLVVDNPALQAGDRIFIVQPPSWVAFVEHAGKLAVARQARQVPPAQPVELK